MFDDMARALGAVPVTVNSSGIYGALEAGTVDAQENPLAYIQFFQHYEVMKYISMTNHRSILRAIQLTMPSMDSSDRSPSSV